MLRNMSAARAALATPPATPEPTPLREALTEKRCRICQQAHWRAPEGWIADHTSEPVDMPLATPPAALDCPCGHDESDHVHYCSADMEQGSCDCAEEYVRLAAAYQQEGEK